VSAHPGQLFSLHIFAAYMQIAIISYFDTTEHNRNICNFLLWRGRQRTNSHIASVWRLNKISGGALRIGSFCCCSAYFPSLNKMCIPVSVPLNSHSGFRESRWSHQNWVRVLNGRMDRAFALVMDIGLKSELPTANQLWGLGQVTSPLWTSPSYFPKWELRITGDKMWCSRDAWHY